MKKICERVSRRETMKRKDFRQQQLDYGLPRTIGAGDTRRSRDNEPSTAKDRTSETKRESVPEMAEVSSSTKTVNEIEAELRELRRTWRPSLHRVRSLPISLT